MPTDSAVMAVLNTVQRMVMEQSSALGEFTREIRRTTAELREKDNEQGRDFALLKQQFTTHLERQVLDRAEWKLWRDATDKRVDDNDKQINRWGAVLTFIGGGIGVALAVAHAFH